MNSISARLPRIVCFKSSFILITTLSDFVKSLSRVHSVLMLLIPYLARHQMLKPVGLMLDVGLLTG